MKNFLLGLIVLVVFVGLALLVTAIAMSGGDSKVDNKDNNGTVEIANADKIVGATEAETEEASVSTESAEQDDLSATPIAEDSSQNDANEEPDENSEKVISGVESSNSSAGYQSGDYFSNNHTDSKAPVYLIKPSTVSVYKGTQFDINSYVGSKHWNNDSISPDLKKRLLSLIDRLVSSRYDILKGKYLK